MKHKCTNLIASWSEWLSFNAKSAIFQLYHGENKLIFNEIFYSASSLKQQSADRHVTPFGHIILIPRQPVFDLSPLCHVLSGEESNTNSIVYGLTRLGLKPYIYHTQGEHANHYTTDVVEHFYIYRTSLYVI
jgi:hypothetical protein